jgi:hypothetical protein
MERAGLQRGSKQQEPLWNEFANYPAGLAAAVAGIRAHFPSLSAVKAEP